MVRESSIIWNKQEGFAFVQKKTTRRALGLNYCESRANVSGRHAQSPVFKVPSIDKQTWNFPLNLLNNRMESEGKAQGTQGVTLLNPTAAENFVSAMLYTHSI